MPETYDPYIFVHTVPIQQRGQDRMTTTCGVNMRARTDEERAGLAFCPFCQGHTKFPVAV